MKSIPRPIPMPRALENASFEANLLAKLVPSKPGVKLVRLLHAPLDGEKSLKEKEFELLAQKHLIKV